MIDSRNNTIKMKKRIFAIDAAPAAILPKPNTAAMMAIIRNVTVQRNIKYNFSFKNGLSFSSLKKSCHFFPTPRLVSTKNKMPRCRSTQRNKSCSWYVKTRIKAFLLALSFSLASTGTKYHFGIYQIFLWNPSIAFKKKLASIRISIYLLTFIQPHKGCIDKKNRYFSNLFTP